MNRNRIEKSVSALLLAGILGISAAFPACAAEKLTRVADGTYTLFSEGDTIDGVLHRGLDVSHWQGEIDWEKARADDVDFVMLGTRFNSAVDPLFAQNAQDADAAGVKLGAYIYSYAKSVEEAEQEADFVLDLVRDYPISYPIAFDVENFATSGTLTKDELTEVVKAFCEKIREAGYYPILYANDFWLNNKLDMNALKQYPVWIAAYEREYDYTTSEPVMWQASSTGTVDGVTGGVDIDLQFTDFSEQIPADSWKKFDGVWYYYEDYRQVRDKLINDGSNSYYMQDDGTIYTGGWMTLDGKKRYFEPSSGVMRLGWRQFSDGWYHFAEDGGLETGWIIDQGQWYLLSDDGIMQTGWTKQNDTWYFLGANGAMRTGWQDLDGVYYFFNSLGAMQTGWIFDQGNWYYCNAAGAMKTGWLNVNDTWYYLGDDGVMRTGVQNVDGVQYYFGTDGAMYHDTTAEVNGVSYDFSSSGAMVPHTDETEAETAGAETTASASSVSAGNAAESGTIAADSDADAVAAAASGGSETDAGDSGAGTGKVTSSSSSGSAGPVSSGGSAVVGTAPASSDTSAASGSSDSADATGTSDVSGTSDISGTSYSSGSSGSALVQPAGN